LLYVGRSRATNHLVELWPVGKANEQGHTASSTALQTRAP
jgi:hypothetical protein